MIIIVLDMMSYVRSLLHAFDAHSFVLLTFYCPSIYL